MIIAWFLGYFNVAVVFASRVLRLKVVKKWMKTKYTGLPGFVPKDYYGDGLDKQSVVVVIPIGNDIINWYKYAWESICRTEHKNTKIVILDVATDEKDAQSRWVAKAFPPGQLGKPYEDRISYKKMIEVYVKELQAEHGDKVVHLTVQLP